MAMKRMTYGQMPTFAEFKKAFKATVDGAEFKMTLQGIDKVTAAPTVLHTGDLGTGWFTPKELYAGVKELVEIWDSNIDAPTSQWSERDARDYGVILMNWERADPNNRYSVEELRENAAYLAGAIMESLGFEWI